MIRITIIVPIFKSIITTIITITVVAAAAVIFSVAVFSNYIYIYIYWLIGLVGRVFANGPGDWGSIPGRVIPKTLKIVLDTFLLNPQQYKVRIKGKVEQSRERSIALPYTLK